MRTFIGNLTVKLKYPIVSLVLDLVLGRLAENSLRQSLMPSGGSLSIFFSRLIPLFCVSAAILAYLTPVLHWAMRSLRPAEVKAVRGPHSFSEEFRPFPA